MDAFHLGVLEPVKGFIVYYQPLAAVFLGHKNTREETCPKGVVSSTACFPNMLSISACISLSSSEEWCRTLGGFD